MEHKKSKTAGRDERLNALASFVDREMTCEWLKRTRGDSRVAEDDILDALALCWSATRLALYRNRALPAGVPPKDDCGLSMEMVF